MEPALNHLSQISSGNFRSRRHQAELRGSRVEVISCRERSSKRFICQLHRGGKTNYTKQMPQRESGGVGNRLRVYNEIVLFLSVNGFRLHSHGSLLERLRECRVSVRRSSDVLGAGTVLNGQDGFRDHLSGIGS